MTIRTRDQYLLKDNAGNTVKISFDGTTATFIVNGTSVVQMSATAFTQLVAEAAAASLVPTADGTLDLGSSSFQWRDLYLSRNLINSAGYLRASVGAALTAHAGGTQAAALALTKQFNFIGTCATAGDSVRLPTSAAGMSVYVYNGGAAAAQVFGASTDTINAVATATGVPLPVGKGAWYQCNAAGTWVTGDGVPNLAEGKYGAATNTTAFTATGAQVAGANSVILNCTGALGSGQALTLPTAADLVAAIPNAIVGQTYRLRIQNTSSGNFAWTVTTNTGLTLTGTMTVAQNTYRDFLVTLTSLTAVAVQSLGQVIVGAI